MGADASLQRLQTRLGQCRRQRTVAQVEVVQQQRGYGSSEHPVTLQLSRRIAAEQLGAGAMDDGDHDDLGQHDHQHADPIREPPQRGACRVQHQDTQDQDRLDRRGHLQEARADLGPAAGFGQRHEQRQAEHHQHDAQNHAQIAKIRQGVPVNVLIYTLHRS
jgi:hypothetical protein